MVNDMEMKPKKLEQGDSFCSPNPYTQLCNALENQDLETFQKLLQRAKIDFDHFYDDPHYGSMLDIACRTMNYSEYVRVLLQNGANPNIINKTRKKAPLHFAVESSDVKTLQYLLDSPIIEVNILDNTGGTALHLACYLEKLEQIKLLVGHRKIRVNALNRKNQTPILIAANKGNKDIVSELLKHKNIDVDLAKTLSGQTARELIQKKLPDLATYLPERKERNSEERDEGDIQCQLFCYLRQRDLESFTKLLADNSKLVNSNDGSHTLLQYACEYGLYDFVHFLIEKGADVNRTCATNNKTPLMLACQQGYYKIVSLLMESDSISLEPINGETIIQTVIKNSTSENATFLAATNEGRNYFKCLKKIMKRESLKTLNINHSDIKGSTALHYAAKTGNKDIILLLLKNGAYVGSRNVFGQPALADIPPKILESYLDSCITTNDKLPREDNYEIIFNYNFLVPAQSYDCKKLTDVESNANSIIPVSETYPLLYMSESVELRPLLTHPILTSFIHLKWYSFRQFFYLNLAFYGLFWFLLTVYILGFYDNDSDGPNESKTNLTQNFNSIISAELNSKTNWIWCLLIFLSVLLFLRELFQFVVSPVQYIMTVENWLEISLLIATSIILGHYCKDRKNQISAIGILLSWGELGLLIGRHPLLSTITEMFKTVSYNFLKFLAWYSILILAFALSFYSLFKDSKVEDNTFLNPGTSIFKTVVMLTGEFDSSSIPFVSNPGTSHILFVLFVFLIAIVLFNLLNGLAVSDTQAIRADAELVGYISRIKLVSYFETMALGNHTSGHKLIQKLKNLCCCIPDSFLNCNIKRRLIGSFSRKTNLFPDSIPCYEIHILPNQENRVNLMQNTLLRKRQNFDSLNDTNSCFANCKMYFMNESTVKIAREILNKKRAERETGQSNENDFIQIENKKKLDEYGVKLQQLELMTLESQKLLQTILILMKNKDGSSSFDIDK